MSQLHSRGNLRFFDHLNEQHTPGTSQILCSSSSFIDFTPNFMRCEEILFCFSGFLPRLAHLLRCWKSGHIVTVVELVGSVFENINPALMLTLRNCVRLGKHTCQLAIGKNNFTDCAHPRFVKLLRNHRGRLIVNVI